MSNQLPFIPGTPETGPSARPSAEGRRFGIKLPAYLAAIAVGIGAPVAAAADIAPVGSGHVPMAALDEQGGVPVPHGETAKSKLFQIPSPFTANGNHIQISAAKKLLKNAHLRYFGLVPTSAKPGFTVTTQVDGFAKKVKPQKRGEKTRYVRLAPGKKVDPKVGVYVKPLVVAKTPGTLPDIGTGGVVDTPGTPVDVPPVTLLPNPPVQPPTPESPVFNLATEKTKFFEANTAYIALSGCSGWILRSKTSGKPKAIKSASHCKLRPDQTPRFIGPDGKPFAYVSSLDYATGSNMSSLRLGAEKITGAVVPPAADKSNDYALLLLDNTSAGEAIALDQATSASASVRAARKVGDKAIISGYPGFQRNRPNSLRTRLDMEASFLAANIFVKTENGEGEVLGDMYGVYETEQGAIPSRGASGGVLQDKVSTERLITERGSGDPSLTPYNYGDLIGFFDYRPGSANSEGSSQADIDTWRDFAIRLSGISRADFDFDAIIFVAQNGPDLQNSEVVRLVKR